MTENATEKSVKPLEKTLNKILRNRKSPLKRKKSLIVNLIYGS